MAERLEDVRARIRAACAAADRAPESVRLIAVSKTHPGSLVREAYAAGARSFGENKAQEGVVKAEELADLADLEWAMIGHLQRNKVNVVTQFATEFHALDSIKLARALDRRLQELGRQLDVFVQVNSSGEDSKFGLPPQEVAAFATELETFDALRVRGLMTLAVFSDDHDAVVACFVRMQQLQDQLRQTDAVGADYDELSMGMSGDFELAIAHGATTVRVGEAIFGRRLRASDYWPS